MSSLNTVYTIEELEGQGVASQELKKGKTIEYSDKVFVRASNHPKKFRDVALKECNTYLQSGIDSFVVESPGYLTIWKENKEKPEPDITDVSPKIESSNTVNVVNIDSKIENLELEEIQTATTIYQEDSAEMYRGAEQKSKKDLSDELSSMAKILHLKPKTRKYRGQDY